MNWIRPECFDPARIGALSTTRHGGISQGPPASLNLGVNNGDDPERVAHNRRRVAAQAGGEVCWLNQVHGREVIHLDDWHEGVAADAAWTDRPGRVAVVQTADCLPVLIAHRAGRAVAAVHAGWRGLAAGIVERTIVSLGQPRNELIAWIGPSICGRCYQVGDEVRAALVARHPGFGDHFLADGERWRADLKAIARHELAAHGVSVHDSGRCTMGEPEHFYSFRRDGTTGNLASLIWIN